MNPQYDGRAEEFRARVRNFLDDNLDADWQGMGALSPTEAHDFLEHWRRLLHEHGLLAVAWPRQYGGRDLSRAEQVVLIEEFTRRGVPRSGPNDVFGIDMLGSTLLTEGTEEQKQYFLPRILSGEDRWCQGFSEPDAGSDLAAVRTTAVRDGDEWIVNGQKVWTTMGHLANWIFVLARTGDPEDRHRGLTFLLCPMDQPGVEVRPIRMISGDSEFNEVFFSDARVPLDHVVGHVGGGWKVAMTLLGHERAETVASAPIALRAELDRLITLARERGRSEDPVLRQRIAHCRERVEVIRLTAMRILTRFLAGEEAGSDASIFKLLWSEYHQQVTALGLEVLRTEALSPRRRLPFGFPVEPAGAPNDVDNWTWSYFNSLSGTIYAGTSEVQRNIIAERALELPR